MTPEQFQRLEDLFHQAMNLPGEARRAFVESECGSDPEMKTELARLLKTPRTFPLVRQMQVDIQRKFQEAIAADGHGIGQRVGQFEITGLLGRGGMGVVYRARDSRLGREVAIKALPAAFMQNAVQLARLEREARILASLSHPNIATLYGLEESGPCPLLIMELLDGETLAQRLARQRLSIEEALSTCAMIAAGVAAAHDAEVIHRDLKPGNICLTRDGQVKVLDFGLARELVDGESADGSREMGTREVMTLRGVILGTPGYMSPEQARGEPIDKRADVFAFGCILYECLTGRVAFAGPTPADALATVIHSEPDSGALPARTPPAVRRLLARCLAKDSRQRTRDMGDVCLELRQALEAREWAAPLAEPDVTPRRAALRLVPWVVTATALLMAGAAFWLKPDPAVVSTPSLKRFSIPFPKELVQKELWYVRLALSRDGRHVLFSAFDDKTADIWLRSDDVFEPRRITEGLNAVSPSFSPDAEWFAFISEGSLMKRRLSGGNAIKIGNAFTWGGSWGNDGSIIMPIEWGQPVNRFSSQGGRPQRITTFDTQKSDVAHLYPRYLPGDQAVVFSVWNGKDPESSVECLTLSTGQRKRLVDKGGSVHFARTPRGNYLLWERSGSIYAAPFDLERLEITGPERGIIDGVLTNGELFESCFDVADDGTLAYVPGPVYFEESRLAWLTRGKDPIPVNDDKSSFGEPQFSRDGKKLSVLMKGTIYTPYIYDLDRGTFTRFFCDGDTETVAISPDGEKIAYTSHRKGGYGIYLRRLSDGQETQIMPPGGSCPWLIQWSADARFLTFTMMPEGGAARDIWIAELGKGPPRPFIATEADERYSTFSNDGQWLAYVVSTETGRRQVYIQSFPDGTRRRQISVGGGDAPQWSEQPGKLYYRNKDGLQLVEISSADGAPAGPPTLIYSKRFGQSDPDVRDYTVAPDGRILIIEHTERLGVVTQINMILNWHDLLKNGSRDAT